MSIGSSTSTPFSSTLPVANSVASQGGNDTLTASGNNVETSANLVDRDGNGWVDVEVDYDSGPGAHFSNLGNRGYQPLNAAQRRELGAQMGDLGADIKVRFHEKGTYASPDAKVRFGTFKQNETRPNLVVGYPSSNPTLPTEVYIRSNPDNAKDQAFLAPTALNRGGNLLARALLYSLGVPARAPAEGEPDSRGYSVHSRNSETTTGQDYKGNSVTRPQIKDFERLIPAFGLNTSATGHEYQIGNLGRGNNPVTMTIVNGHGHDTLDAASDTHDQVIDMHAGKRSSVGGFKDNVIISPEAVVEDVKTGSGTNSVAPNIVPNRITLGQGSNTVAFQHRWDSTPERLDTIVGFKTGVDKIDISAFGTTQGSTQFGVPNGSHLEIQSGAAGGTYVSYWKDFVSRDSQAPDFKVRADGVQMSDIVRT
ncbi:M10 family metallopeptidase C-terminal domain-containing protein [Pseudomonas fluorescens]